MLAEVKNDDELRRSRSSCSTTSKAEEDVLRSYDLHANAYVTKPVDFDRFIEVVRQIDEFFVSVVKLPKRGIGLTGPGEDARPGRLVGAAGDALTAGQEQRRRRRDAGADAAAEVGPDRPSASGARRSASKRSTSRPRRSARAHRCGSSSRPWSANSASCMSQNASWRAAASAASAAGQARGCESGRGSGGSRRVPARPARRSSSAAQNGHSKSA